MSSFKNVILGFDFPQRSVDWTDAELKDYAKHIASHKVHYVRCAPFWWDERNPKVPMPFLVDHLDTDGRRVYNLDRPNDRYDEALRRFAKFTRSRRFWWKTKFTTPEIWFDLWDNCGQGRDWSPWVNNINGVNGIYEYNARSLSYYRSWNARIFGILGKRAHYGLGNELYFPAWQNVAEANAWGEKWVLGTALQLRALGVREPISFSADLTPHGTASRIVGWLTEVGGYGGAYGEHLIQMLHGMGLPVHWETLKEKDILSANVGLGLSDDGVGMNDKIIPPEMRGNCEEPGQRCKANRTWRFNTAKAMFDDLRGRLRMVEFMPAETAMSYKPITDLGLVTPKNPDDSLAVFDDIKKI